MELRLPPDVETRLARIAAERGTDAEALAAEAIERFLDYDAWFLQEVKKGLAAADRCEFVEHEDVRKLLDSRYPPG
jgi:predicted transcriptional regulator